MDIIRNLMNKTGYINKNGLYMICFGVVYLLWNYTAFIRSGGAQELFNAGFSTLDASWVIGLNWASSLHLPWARDNLIFTFGPLYYLDGFFLPEFHRHRTLLIVHVGMNLLFVSCFSYVFSFFSDLHHGANNRWLLVIVAVLLLTQKPSISLLPLFVAFISLPIIFPKDEIVTKATAATRYIRYGIVSSILAFLPFTKFSHIYESLLFVVVLVLFLTYCRRFFDAALVSLLFIISSLLIWVLESGQGISSYLPYLQTRLILSGGYTEAMMIGFSQPLYFQIFILALSYLAALGLVLIYFLFTKQINWMTAWLLPLISLFLGFKSSFVRADAHAYIFLSYVFLSALYYFYLVEFNETEMVDVPWRPILARTFVPFLSIIVYSSYSLFGGRLEIRNELLEVQKLIRADPNVRSFNQNLSRRAIRTTYNLDSEFLSQIDPKKTIDIIPSDIALLYGYDLVWMPRPVIQSYASYTSELDSLDAEFFRKPNSPEQLIVSLSTFDQRYILFDTPATFRTLLDAYEYISQSSEGRFALFRKKTRTTFRDPVLIAQNEYKFSEKISVPEEQHGHVFLFAEIEPTILGKLLNVFYKPTTLFIEITFENGEQKLHRFISDTGKNGLFVSKYVESLDDLEAIFNETYDQNITSVRFLGDGKVYKEPFRVHFYKLLFRK